MFSVTYTGMNLLPLCTAMVCPTKSGDIIEARAHVLTTVFLPLSFMALTFFSKFRLIYGPFFNDLLIFFLINQLLFLPLFNYILRGVLFTSSCFQALSV